MLTGKEKLQKTLNHEECPILIDVGGFPTTSIHCSIVEKLRDYFGLERRLIKIQEPMQMLGVIDDDLKKALGVQTSPLWNNYDMFGVKHENFKEHKTHWGQIVLVPENFNISFGDTGDMYLHPQGRVDVKPSGRMPKTSYFFDGINRAEDFDEDNYNLKDNLEEYGEIKEDVLEFFRAESEKLKNSDDAVLGNFGGTGIGDIALVSGLNLIEPKGIRSVEDWYIATITMQDELNEIFSYQVDFAIKNLEKILKEVKDTIQVAYVCGTDFGTQKAPFCSNEVFKKLYASHYRKLNDWIHSHTSWKTFKHSCGSINSLIPELINVGFDCLNPVQWTADNMDKIKLKEEFGKDIVFWGGGIDTQKTLPFGTPQNVYDETIDCCKVFSKGGGYVFNTIHNIQACTPIENLAMMFKAIKDFNGEK